MFENMENFEHLGMMVINGNCIYEEIKSKIILGNACYRAVQNLLSLCLLMKNITIKKYKSIMLAVVLCGCETWSLMLRE
jgi:hypothetical protein